MPIPVISVAQMREWEALSWAAGKTAAKVIDQVGQAIARRLEQSMKPGEKVLFLAGKGHNGDDVRAARKHFGRKAGSGLLNIIDPDKGSAAFAKALEANYSWIVDGLFGIGLNRALDSHWQKLIRAVNHSNIPVLAIDVPSGLNAEDGREEGAAIAAEITLTIGAPKYGLLRGAKWTGRLEVLTDIGLIPCPFKNELQWTLARDFAGLPPRRAVESNKGTFGHLAIFAGSFGYHGAAVLAGHGALRARPGLVSLFPQESVYVPVASQCQSIMVHAWRPRQALPKSCNAILFGPGLADPKLPKSMRAEMVAHWHKSPFPVVGDASALDWLRPGATPAGAIRVITPHPGEAGRMLGCSASEVQSDRILAVRKLSKRLGNCFVLLKGNQTLVGSASGKVFVNSSGNPYLGQGGSGDLLGGFLAGLLAQAQWQDDPVKTIRYAVWQHGAAADRLSAASANWTIEDLSRVLGDKIILPAP